MLKSIVKLHDENGRFVIPKAIRDKMRITPSDLLTIETDGKRIVIEKCGQKCAICDTELEGNIGTLEILGRYVCEKCTEKINIASRRGSL